MTTAAQECINRGLKRHGDRLIAAVIHPLRRSLRCYFPTLVVNYEQILTELICYPHAMHAQYPLLPSDFESLSNFSPAFPLLESVAVILERESSFVIEEWLRRVNRVPELATIPLSNAQRTCHLPGLFDDVVSRLRLGGNVQTSTCMSAQTHGNLRFAQGYSLPMLVEESRLFEVCTFSTLHLHRSNLIQSEALSDVVTIADEADRQLAEAVRGFNRSGSQSRRFLLLHPRIATH